MNKHLLELLGAAWAIDFDYLSEALRTEHYGPAELEAMRAAMSDKAAAGIQMQEGAIAVVPIMGVLTARPNIFLELFGLGVSAETIGKWLTEARDDAGVKAIILDINSPGGQVAGTPELAALIRSVGETKPVIAQVNHSANSAAYWLASQASDIAITPSGEAGSIGVLAIYRSMSAEDQEQTEIMSAGRFKGEQAGEPLTDAARQAIQHRIDQAYDLFVNDVAQGRGVTPDAVKAGFGEGRTLSAPDALAAGLVDRVATFSETVARFMSARQDQVRRSARRRAQARARALDVAAYEV